MELVGSLTFCASSNALLWLVSGVAFMGGRCFLSLLLWCPFGGEDHLKVKQSCCGCLTNS